MCLGCSPAPCPARSHQQHPPEAPMPPHHTAYSQTILHPVRPLQESHSSLSADGRPGLGDSGQSHWIIHSKPGMMNPEECLSGQRQLGNCGGWGGVPCGFSSPLLLSFLQVYPPEHGAPGWTVCGQREPGQGGPRSVFED